MSRGEQSSHGPSFRSEKSARAKYATCADRTENLERLYACFSSPDRQLRPQYISPDERANTSYMID